jgi:hypothetical protein
LFFPLSNEERQIIQEKTLQNNIDQLLRGNDLRSRTPNTRKRGLKETHPLISVGFLLLDCSFASKRSCFSVYLAFKLMAKNKKTAKFD